MRKSGGARLRARVVSRRHLLAGGAALAGGALVGLPGCDPGGVKDTGDPATTIPPVTPNDEFYVTTYNVTQVLDGEAWELVVKDRGAEVARIDLAGLEAMGPRDKEHTLECISAGEYHLAIGNAVWTGLPLADVLAGLGVTAPAEAIELKFTSADDYTTAVPVGDLAAIWVVWRMNGEPLPLEHGYPVRLLVPGRYGMKNPKWIVEIDFVDTPHVGYWEERGWSNDCTYLPNVLIHIPTRLESTVEAGPVRVLGTAFAGSDPVVRVEYRVDGGDWADATLDYAPGADIWTLWSVDLELAEGTHVVQARCTAASGAASSAAGTATDFLSGYDGSMELEIEAV